VVIVIGSGSDDLADKSSHRLVTSADHHMRELDKDNMDILWLLCSISLHVQKVILQYRPKRLCASFFLRDMQLQNFLYSTFTQ